MTIPINVKYSFEYVVPPPLTLSQFQKQQPTLYRESSVIWNILFTRTLNSSSLLNQDKLMHIVSISHTIN